MLALSFFKLFAAFNSTWIIWSSFMHAISKELLSVCFMPGAVLGAGIETTVNSTETILSSRTHCQLSPLNMPNSSFSSGILDHLSKRRNPECSPESWGEGYGRPLTSHITGLPSHGGGLFSRIYTENSKLMFYINRGKDTYVCSQRVQFILQVWSRKLFSWI